MRLAKCLKSRLTEKKENKKENKKKTNKSDFVSFFFLLFFSVIRFVFHVRHSVGTKSDAFCDFGSKKCSHTHSYAHGTHLSLSLSLSGEKGAKGELCLCVCVCGLVLLTRSVSLWCFSFGHSASEMEPKKNKEKCLPPLEKSKKAKWKKRIYGLGAIFLLLLLCEDDTHAHKNKVFCCKKIMTAAGKYGAFSFRLSTPGISHPSSIQAKTKMRRVKPKQFIFGGGWYTVWWCIYI